MKLTARYIHNASVLAFTDNDSAFSAYLNLLPQRKYHHSTYAIDKLANNLLQLIYNWSDI